MPAVKLATHHEVVKHDLTRRRANTKQARRLVEVETQAGHLAVRPQDHRDKMGPGWFATLDAADFTAPLSRGVGLHSVDCQNANRAPRKSANPLASCILKECESQQ